MKNQRGITLIALVITIIVLLILAGVSIAMLTGENGILTRADDAAEETAFATARENVANAINEAMTEYYGNTYADNGSTTISGEVSAALRALVGDDDGGATIAYTTGTVTITFGDKTQEGTVTESTGKVEWGAVE